MELSQTIVLLRKLLEALQMHFTHLMLGKLGPACHRIIITACCIQCIEFFIAGRCVKAFLRISIEFQTSNMKVYATVVEN